MEPYTGVVIFLAAQAGALIWILSRHDADLRNLRGWVGHIANSGDINGRNIGKLEGVNEGKSGD
jgi:hypothetical protein